MGISLVVLGLYIHIFCRFYLSLTHTFTHTLIFALDFQNIHNIFDIRKGHKSFHTIPSTNELPVMFLDEEEFQKGSVVINQFLHQQISHQRQ